MTDRGLASRQNGARSRGPSTAEGKARSSQNATKHGLTARAAIVLPLVERAEDWSAHLAGFVSAMQSVGAVEQELVERMAAITWRLRRVERVEAAMIAGKLLDADTDAAAAAKPADPDDEDNLDEYVPNLDELRDTADHAERSREAHRRVWAAAPDELLAAADVAVIVRDVEAHDGTTADGALDGWQSCTWTRVSLLAALEQVFGGEGQRRARIVALCGYSNATERDADARRRHARLVATRQVYWGGDTLERYEAHLTRQLALTLATLRALREL